MQDPADLRVYAKHTREMAPCNMGLGEDSWGTIAMDEVEVLVESILDHNNRSSTKKTDFDFLVRWKNQGPDEDAWTLYVETRQLEAFDVYAWAHPELRRLGIYPGNSGEPKAIWRPAKSRKTKGWAWVKAPHGR